MEFDGSACIKDARRSAYSDGGNVGLDQKWRLEPHRIVAMAR